MAQSISKIINKDAPIFKKGDKVVLIDKTPKYFETLEYLYYEENFFSKHEIGNIFTVNGDNQIPMYMGPLGYYNVVGIDGYDRYLLPCHFELLSDFDKFEDVYKKVLKISNKKTREELKKAFGNG